MRNQVPAPRVGVKEKCVPGRERPTPAGFPRRLRRAGRSRPRPAVDSIRYRLGSMFDISSDPETVPDSAGVSTRHGPRQVPESVRNKYQKRTHRG